ncbi:MAG: PaaI family thioesterase [Candidatus Eremiobacteraeota bacterium]|nr:PaaI family thioesterase [Candidatus Eremiobacteraeota bacterium]
MSKTNGAGAGPERIAPALEDDRRCFACGPENAEGMQLRFQYGDGTASAVWRPSPRFSGWTSMVHGGIVATLLDEAMAHAAIAAGVRAVTGRLEIRFRKAAPMDSALVAHGRVEQRRGRMLMLSATVAGEDGTLYAQATGKFLAE